MLKLANHSQAFLKTFSFIKILMALVMQSPDLFWELYWKESREIGWFQDTVSPILPLGAALVNWYVIQYDFTRL